MRRWLHSSMKCAPLMAASEQHAVIGDDPYRAAHDMREARDQRVAKARFEFVKAGPVHQPRDDLADVIGRAQIGGDDAQQFVGS
jgi:hypothetical protein